MVRRLGPVFAGLLIFGAVVFLAGVVARSIWPDYAAAVPDRTYTLPMLLARLFTGAAATAVAGWGTSRIAQGDRFSAIWLGIVLLAISLPWHIHIWHGYPTWYHFVWFGCLIPSALLGGRSGNVPLKAC